MTFLRSSRSRSGLFMAIAIAVSAIAGSPVFAQSARPAASSSADQIGATITEASRRFGIPESWIRSVMHVESRGRSRAVSHAGAMGLMQVMPATYAGLRIRHRLGRDPFDIRDNILAGTAYLREMYDRYGSPGFLAAYNAGPGRWEQYVRRGRPLPRETRNYLARLAHITGFGAGPVLADLAISERASPLTAALFVSTESLPQDGPSAQSSQFDRPSGDTLYAPADVTDTLFVRTSNAALGTVSSPSNDSGTDQNTRAQRSSHPLFASPRAPQSPQ